MILLGILLYLYIGLTISRVLYLDGPKDPFSIFVLIFLLYPLFVVAAIFYYLHEYRHKIYRKLRLYLLYKPLFFIPDLIYKRFIEERAI